MDHKQSLVLDDNNGERMVPETYGGSTFGSMSIATPSLPAL